MAAFSFSFFVELSLRYGILWEKSLYSLWGCLTSPWRWFKYIQAIFHYRIREWAAGKLTCSFTWMSLSLQRWPWAEWPGWQAQLPPTARSPPAASEQLHPPFVLRTGGLPIPAAVLTACGLEDHSGAWDPSLSVSSANKDTRKAFQSQRYCDGL